MWPNETLDSQSMPIWMFLAASLRPGTSRSRPRGAAPARAFVEKLDLNYPVVMGNAKLGEQYGGVLGVPVTFLIDRAGMVRARFDGEEHLAAEERQMRGLLGHPGH